MRKSKLLSGLLLTAAIAAAPVVSAQAKDVPVGENIPLTEEYFPDEWFLEDVAKPFDLDGNGVLSPQERAKATKVWCEGNLSDFSQVQYFTSLTELVIRGEVDAEHARVYGVWVGNTLDLAVFPNLERAELRLDSTKAPSGQEKVTVKVSGLKKLVFLQVYDEISGEACGFDGSNTNIEAIDLRDTPQLGYVVLSDVKGVAVDDVTQISSMELSNMQDIPLGQIAGFGELTDLTIHSGSKALEHTDISTNKSLVEFYYDCDSLRELILPETLGALSLESDSLEAIDLSGSKGLWECQLTCPKLTKAVLAGADMLQRLRIYDSPLTDIDLSKSAKLSELCVWTSRAKALNLTGGPGLKDISVSGGKLEKLNLKQMKNLEELSVTAKSLKALDVTKCKRLSSLHVEKSASLSALDVSKNKELKSLSIMKCANLAQADVSKNVNLTYLSLTGSKKLTKLDLSKNKELADLHVTGCKKLTRLNLTKNKKLRTINVNNNTLKALKLGQKQKLRYIYCKNNKLKILDLTGTGDKLELVSCDKGVKVRGYEGKIFTGE